MVRYMTFGKYSAAGAAAAYKDGFGTRAKVLGDYINGLGGTLLEMRPIAEDEWDFVAIYDFEDMKPAKRVAHGLLTFSSGGFERSTTYTLSTVEEADAIRAEMPGYRAPGQ